MAIATPSTAHPKPAGHAGGHAPVPTHTAPVSPGKVAMWLFLATEVMFFTGLIGSYIVLRAGSTHTGYSNLYSPASSLSGRDNTHGILLKSAGSSHETVEHILHAKAGLSEEEAKKLVEAAHHSQAL